MKRALKYTLSTLAAAAVAAPVYAGHGHDIVANTTLKAAATYTEATNNGLAFAYNGSSATTWRPLFLEPDHEWDYSVGLEYHIPGSNTRAVVEYDHFRDHTTRGVTGASAFGQASAAANTVDANVVHKDRDFKLGLRHTVDLGSRFDLVLGGLIEHSKVQRTFTNMFNDGTNYYSRILDESKGWGPHVDALGRAYPWGKGRNSCWSLWARGGLGLLYTDQKFQAVAKEGNGNFADGNYDSEEAQSIVARLEADMGVEFKRVMRADFADMQLGMRLGVRYMNMQNAFKNGAFTQLGTAANPANANTQRDDYGRMGAFLEFRLGGANA